MPSPKADEEASQKLRDLEGWLVAVLDLKFAQQEALIKGLLGVQKWGALDERSRSNLSPQEMSPYEEGDNNEGDPSDGMMPVQHLQTDLTSADDRPVRNTKSELTRKNTATLGTAIMQERWEPEPPAKAFIKKKLDGYMGCVVIFNMLFMVLYTQWIGARAEVALSLRPEGWPFFSQRFFDISEYFFFILYVADVVVRLGVLRNEWYYDPQEGYMYLNMFDAFLVCLSTVELIVLPAALSAGGDTEFQASAIRVLKLMRIYRTLRIVKTMHVFRQLRLLVRTCVASIGALFWSLVLLLLLNIGFALMMAQALQTFILDDTVDLDARTQINEFYGSFTRSFYTIFEVTHSGSWPSRVRPVLDLVNPWYAALFLPYIALVVFAVIRVVTALFIKETLASAANDAELAIEETRRNALEYQEKLEELFQIVDDDGDGHLTPEEFIEAMSLPSVQQYMKFLDVSVRDVRPLFDILSEGDGLITIAEFCQGLMQLKGQARALDIVILQHENSKVMRQCQEIYRAICDTASQLSPRSS